MVEVGSWIWIPDEKECVLPGKVSAISQGAVQAVLEDGEVWNGEIARENLQQLDTQCLDPDVSNLIGLSNLSENAILHNLRIRFSKDYIYTFVSSILIAVNPFRQVPLYGVETRERYLCTADKSTLPPHIFTVADGAFRAMMSDSISQSIVISGESGAGKTESTKVILEYLAELSSGDSQDSDDNLQHQILQCNPVMEAFGNAKTVRNNNSSRFGKLITINFLNGTIKGASIVSYLLEKSRVVNQHAQERNYHFFYELLAAASGNEELSKMLKLGNSNEKSACDPEDFWYTNQSSIHAIEGVNDSEEFNEVWTAMETLGMTTSNQHDICKIIAAILHLGNIEFSEAETSGDVAAKIKELYVVGIVCSLLQINETELERCLTSKNIGARSIITCRYTPAQANDARDALSKKLYANLFDWLIKFINATLAGNSGEVAQKEKFIAVLDIFGFEAFEHNSFEQLCINYCNEKLQFHFNNHIFLMEQEEYAREGINVSSIKFEDNQATLDLLDLKGSGLFSMIDEEISVPRGSDEQLLSKMFQKHIQHNNFERPKGKKYAKNDLDALFVVVHYAGPVAYNVTGFLEKNKDQLSEDLEQICKVSTSPFVQELFGRSKQECSDNPPPKPKMRASSRRGGGATKTTLGGEFKKQLVSLMDTLNATDPHFIRCMKPNMEKVGKKFDSNVMLAQLRYAGLVEVCRIRQLGFPYRMPFQKFLSTFLVLVPSAGNSAETVTKKMVENKYLLEDEYAIGSSKVFLKHSTLHKLNSLRDEALKGLVASIQRVVRGRLIRKKYLAMTKILSNLKKAIESASASVDAQQLENALADAVELPHEGLHISLVKEGKNLARKVTEELRVKSLLEEAINERLISALEGALDTAKKAQQPFKIKDIAMVINEAESVLETLRKEKVHLDKVSSLIKSGKIEELENWMDVAEELGLGNTDAARSIEVIIARVCEERAVLEDLTAATESKNLQEISALLGKAAEMGLENESVAKAKKTQHMLESIASGIAAINAALETSHLQSIREAIVKAKTFGVSYDDPLLRKASFTADILEKADEVEKKLKVALDNQSIDELSSLIATGERTVAADTGCKIDIPSLPAAVTLIESLRRQQEQNEAEKEEELKMRKEHADKMQSALDRQEIPYLRSLLVQAKGMGLGADESYKPLLKKCDEAVERMKQKQELEIALNSAVRSKNVERLAQCISNVESSGLDIKLDSAKKTRDMLLSHESISKSIGDALTKNDMAALARLVKEADDSKYSSRQVEDARALIDRGANLSQVLATLKTSNSNGAIVEAIENAINLGLDKNDPVIETARSRLADMSIKTEKSQNFKVLVKNFEIRASTENGIRKEDLEPLKKLQSEITSSVLKSNQDTKFDSLLQDIKMQIARGESIIKHQAVLDNLTAEVGMQELKSSIRKAADLGLKNYRGCIMATAMLEKLSTQAGKEEAPQGDEDEGEEMSYEEMDRMKEELYAEARQLHYTFSNYPWLRSAEEFAKGNMLNKKKIMEYFLKHQKSPIGRSLSAVTPPENKMAIMAFKSLLGYIGDKAVTFPASHARDFVLMGLKNPSLRAELMLQCIKQTISNPSSYSQMRSFHVLCMCCDNFAPPPGFHKYLLNFLLSHAESTPEGQEPTPAAHMAFYALARIQIMVQQSGQDPLDDVDVETIEAYTNRMPAVAKIYTPDEAMLGELLVAPDVDVDTLLLLITQILDIHPNRKSVLGLYVVTTKSSDLAPMTLLADRDFYIGDLYQPPLSQKVGRPLKFYVKRKLLEDSYLTPLQGEDVETADNVAAMTNLTYCHLAMKMADDSIRITNEKTASLLAAYQLAVDAEYIAGRADIALAQGVLKNISPTLRESKEPSEWGDLVAESLHQCVGKEDDELKEEYIKLIDTLPTARMHTYMCVKGGGSSPSHTSDVPNEFILGVNSKGMFFMDCDDENESPTILYTLRYPFIKKFTLRSNTIKFTLEKAPGELYTLEIVTPLNEELCQLCLAFRPRKKTAS